MKYCSYQSLVIYFKLNIFFKTLTCIQYENKNKNAMKN